MQTSLVTISLDHYISFMVPCVSTLNPFFVSASEFKTTHCYDKTECSKDSGIWFLFILFCPAKRTGLHLRGFKMMGLTAIMIPDGLRVTEGTADEILMSCS